jgi:hypothetical protein
VSERSAVLLDLLYEVNNDANSKLRQIERHRAVHGIRRRRERGVLRREYETLDALFRAVHKMLKREQDLNRLNSCLANQGEGS